MKKSLVVMALLATAFAASGHTTAESNAVVRAALNRALTFYPCDLEDFELPADIEEPNTWHGLLGGDVNGWTFAEKKAAFDWYLSTLGTKDCKSLDREEQEEIRIAVGKCDELRHTNSALPMKALALNPRGICRGDAIELAIRYGTIDDSMTFFVETILTNTLGYTRSERGVACGMYSEKLISCNATNEVDVAQRNHAINMLYRHRQCGLAGVNMLDNLFSVRIEGYAMSSNRLEFANFVLGHPDARDFNIRKFTSVTNQLLSSGQPLVQLDIGEGGK